MRLPRTCGSLEGSGPDKVGHFEAVFTFAKAVSDCLSEPS